MAHARCIFDYPWSVEKTIKDNKDLYVSVYSRLLKGRDLLDTVEAQYSSTEKPWLFLALGASLLAKDKMFALVEADVSKTILCYVKVHIF